MAYPQTVLESLAKALHESGRLPDETTYATLEIDPEGKQANVTPPVVEITVETLQRETNRNTELVNYETDSNGNHIGKIYRSSFILLVRFDCWSADGDSYDSRDMGNQLRDALALYDSRKMGETLPHPDSGKNTLDDVWNVAVGETSRPNDLSMTPALRRTRTLVECRFSDEYSSTDYYGPQDYIQDYEITTEVL